VEHDVHEGREHLNLSSWEQYSIDNRIDLLGKMGTQLRQGKMPLKQYLVLHSNCLRNAALVATRLIATRKAPTWQACLGGRRERLPALIIQRLSSPRTSFGMNNDWKNG
jgi:hypothetical protein